MRQPNGRMGKQDRRACLAAGVYPVSDYGPPSHHPDMVAALEDLARAARAASYSLQDFDRIMRTQWQR